MSKSDFIMDRQKLIDYSFEFANKLLADYQEFYPFAATINLKGELIPVTYYDGNEYPNSQELIDKLKILLDDQLRDGERRAYALTCDVTVRRNDLSNRKDAIAIQIKHQDAEKNYTCFFAYRLTEQNAVEHLDSWEE